MAVATTDQLIIKIDVENEKALEGIDEVLAKLTSLDRAASKDSLKNFVNLGSTLERFAEASEKLSKVNFGSLQNLLKGLENIDAAKMGTGVEVASSSMRKLSDALKGIDTNVGHGLAEASNGIGRLANALVRYRNEDYAGSVDNVRKVLLKLAPAVQQAGKYGTQLNNMRLAIENLGPALRTFGKAESYADAIRNVGITIKELASAIMPLQNAPVQQLKALADALKKLGETGADNALASNMAHLAKGVTTLVTVLSYGIKDSVAEKFARFTDTVLPALKSLSGVLTRFTKMGVDESLGTKLASAAGGIVTLINTLTSRITPEDATKFGELAGALSSALKPLSSVLAQLQKLGSAADLGANLTSAARGIITFIETFATGASESLLAQFSKAAGVIGPAFKAMASGLRNISKISTDDGFAASMQAAQQALISFVSTLNSSLSEEAVSKFARLAQGIKDVGDALKRINANSARRIQEATPSSSMLARFNALARKLTGMKANFASAGDAARSFGRRFMAIPFSSTTKAVNNLAHSISVLKGRIGRVILLRAIRSGFAKLTSAIKNGTNALYLWATTAGNSFVGTMDSLATSFLYLRNSMAAATSPLVDALAPALNHVIDLIVGALNVFNQFVAALTGATTWRKAIKKTVSYSDYINGIGDSANGASGAVKEFEKQLMGFDEINNITLPKDSGSGSGNSAIEDAAGMFEEMDVSSNIADWVTQLKNAWENSDWEFFEDFGRQIGEKIITGLSNIPWDEIQTSADKLGRAFASTLNGVLDAEVNGIGFGEALGTSLAEAINTAWAFLDGFLDQFDFTSLGRNIIQGIVAFFETLDWNRYSSILTHMFTGLLDTLSGILTGIDWSEVPLKISQQIAEFFSGIDFTDLARSIAQFITSALIACVQFISGFDKLAKSAIDSIKDYFLSYINSGPFDSVGANIIYGIWAGITDAIANAATWLKNNIFVPILDGIKAAFGISSPATKMYDVGRQIMAGIWEGLKEKVTDVIEWCKGFPDMIKGVIGDVSVTATATYNAVAGALWDVMLKAWDSIKNAATTATATFTAIAGGGIETILTLWDKLKNGDKKNLTLNAKKKGNMTDKYLKTVQAAWSKISDLGKSFKLTIKTSGVTNALGNALDKIQSAWNNIRGGTKTLTLSFVDKFKSAFSAVWDWIQQHAPASIKNQLAGGGVFKGAKWYPVTTAATGGGFSAGQMFIAREAGPELVGTIGGNTAVMNNDQIVSSVSDGVYRAVVAAMGTGGGDIVLKVDNNVLARATIRGINNVTRQQGKLMLDLG